MSSQFVLQKPLRSYGLNNGECVSFISLLINWYILTLSALNFRGNTWLLLYFAHRASGSSSFLPTPPDESSAHWFALHRNHPWLYRPHPLSCALIRVICTWNCVSCIVVLVVKYHFRSFELTNWTRLYLSFLYICTPGLWKFLFQCVSVSLSFPRSVDRTRGRRCEETSPCCNIKAEQLGTWSPMLMQAWHNYTNEAFAH